MLQSLKAVCPSQWTNPPPPPLLRINSSQKNAQLNNFLKSEGVRLWGTNFTGATVTQCAVSGKFYPDTLWCVPVCVCACVWMCVCKGKWVLLTVSRAQL